MNGTRLTDEADLMLCTLYQAYTERRKCGESRFDACVFGGSETMQMLYFPAWSTDDIDDILWELARNGLLDTNDGDNTVQFCMLTSDALVYMQHRFGDRLDALIQKIKDLKALGLGL